MPFAAIYIPDFLLQAVIRANPALRNSPLALLGGSPPLWSVVAADPAAFEAGIQLGMTKAQVAQFGNVQIWPRQEAQERSAHAALLDIAWSISPRVEDTAPDTLVLDLNGLSPLFGSEENIAEELAKRAAAVGLAPRIAVASNIETAIHAAHGFCGTTIISPGEERKRVSDLPLGVLTTQKETLEILQRWGIDTLDALAALPVLQLSERLGQEGVRLSELARGTRNRSLVLAQPAMRFTEEMEIDDAVEELEPLSFLLGRLLDQICARLEARALSVRTVSVNFELQPSFEKDFQVLKEEIRKRPETRHYSKTLSLPVPIRNPKTLLKLLRLQLQNDPPSAPIQKIGMTADSAVPRVTQNGLFAPAGPDSDKLELTMARLTKLVGEGRVGRVQLEDSHRPESFHLKRFTGINEHENVRARFCRSKPAVRSISAKSQPKGSSSLLSQSPPGESPIAALRMARPPEAIRVDVQNGQPARVFLRGVWGKVVAVSGPWRSSGDWWQEPSWHQDEWDLEIEVSSKGRRQESSNAQPERGLYRIYFDFLHQRWFVRGIYD